MGTSRAKFVLDATLAGLSLSGVATGGTNGMHIELSIPQFPTGIGLHGTVTVSAAVSPKPQTVDLQLDGANQITLSQPTSGNRYDWVWDTAKFGDGTHQIDAKARYKQRTSTAHVAVTVNNTVVPPPPDPPPTTGYLYDVPVLRSPTTILVPAGVTVFNVPAGDHILDCQKIPRGRCLNFQFQSGQRAHVINLYTNITDPQTADSSFWLGGPNFGGAFDYVMLADSLITGKTMCDGAKTAASPTSKLLLRNVRVESNQMNGGTDQQVDHADCFQVQGAIGAVYMDNVTLYPQNVANTDPGKGMMLKKEGTSAVAFPVYLHNVNMHMVGRCGAAIFQNTTDISIHLDGGVFVDAAQATWQKWADGSDLFYNPAWTSSGTAPGRVANFPAGAGWVGTDGHIYEGTPAGGDYATRASVGIG